MFIELHLLQNFAPSCLNRDDTNTPKDCEFGGQRRARISSQCSKRSFRRYFRAQDLLPREYLADRSKRLIGKVVQLLIDKGRPAERAVELVKGALASVRLTAPEKNETQYLLFLGQQEIAALANVVHTNWDELGAVAAPVSDAAPSEGEKKGKPKTAKQKKAEAKEAVPAEVVKQVKAIFNGGKAADVALFGRMLADQADLNVDAACQVAHALSTNRINIEMDFFTAVDDLKEKREAQDAGAGMLGTVEFNSACFYRYANLDIDQLTKNLQGDAQLARKTVEAFLSASIHAIPTGKQNTFAAHNPPSLVFAVVRERGLFSLANAFEKPVRPDREGSLVQNSVRALDTYWGRLVRMFGRDGLKAAAVCVDDESVDLKALADYRAESVNEVISKVMAHLPNGEGV
jgi:CRISPR system Cascade subunit CasC